MTMPTMQRSLLFANPRAYWLAQARIKAHFALDWRSQGFPIFVAVELKDVAHYMSLARRLPITRPNLPR